MPPRSKQPVPERLSAEAIVAGINRRFGPGTVVQGGEMPEPPQRITTGSLGFDVALGGGGWPANQWSELVGEYCLAPQTLVLCADLAWRRIDELSVGDEIVGFDEELGTSGPGRARTRYRRASVTSLGRKSLMSYRVRHPFGETVASAGHMWLVRTSEKCMWKRTSQLRPGDRIVAFGPPWQTDQSRSAGWLAGLFDGEGWVELDRIGVAQVPGLVLTECQQQLEQRGFTVSVYDQNVGKGSCKTLRFIGESSVNTGWYQSLRFLGEMRPHRLLEKSSRLWENRATWSQAGTLAVVESVEPIGWQDVVTIGTSTKTLVADGLLSHNSSGKTAVALKTVAANQALDPDFSAVWIAAESYYKPFADMLGVDSRRMWVVETNVMEIAYDAVIEFLDSRGVDLIVIDSLPALFPETEGDGKMEDFQVGLTARMTGKFFRKAGSVTKRSMLEVERPVVGLMINQWREKIGVTYGDNRTTPGGRGKDYAYFSRVEVRRDEWIIEGSNGPKVGQSIKFRPFKNKQAPANRTAVVDFYFANSGDHRAGDYDLVKQVFNLALYFDIAVLKGNGYVYRGERYVGKAGFFQALRENPDLYAQISTEVVAAATGQQVPAPPVKLVKPRTAS